MYRKNPRPKSQECSLPETDMRERALRNELSVWASGWKHLIFLAPVKHTSSEVPNPGPQQVPICLKVAGAVQICTVSVFFFLICWFWHRPYCWFNEPSVINRITDPRGLILSCLIHWRVTVTMVNNCLKSNQNYSFKFECQKCLHSDLFRGNLLPLSSSQRKKMAPKEQMSTPQMLPLWELHRRQCWGQLQSAETGGCEAGMWPNCDCSLPTTAFFLPSGLG